MSVLDTLITDRGPSDLASLTSLLSKPLPQWTEDEVDWFLEAKSKGAYNYTDLNRVGEATAYLAEQFTAYGYSVTVNPKTDWMDEDSPTASQLEQYLNDLSAVRNVFSVIQGTPNVPSTMNKLTYQTANDIEKILENTGIIINRILASFKRSGQFTFWCGNENVLPAAQSDMGRPWEELDAMQTTWDNWGAANWYLLLYGNLEDEVQEMRTWKEMDAMDTTWRNWQVATWDSLLYGDMTAEGDVE